MKGQCPVCNKQDYDARTLKEHLLLCHRERPVLAKTILDLLDLVGHLRSSSRERPAHDGTSCILCRKMGQAGQH